MDESSSVNESQFEARESDGETLWEVIEITAEKNKKFRVRWAGMDPKTKKPYAQSWVHRRDVTDDLVYEWRRKKALKKNRANSKSAVFRASNSPHKRSQTDWDSPPKASSSKSGKRRLSTQDDRPSKKQRLIGVDLRAPAARKTSKTMDWEWEEDSDTPSTMASKGKQRASPVGDSDHPPPAKGKRKPLPLAEQGQDELERPSVLLKRLSKGKPKQPPVTDEDNAPVKGASDFEKEEEESEAYARPPEKPHPQPTKTTSKQKGKSSNIPKVLKADAHTSRIKSKNNPRKHVEQSADTVTESQVLRRMSPSDVDRLQQFDNEVETQRMRTPPRPRTPVLSPTALDRLREFDDFLLQVEAEARQFYPPSPERVSRPDYRMSTVPHLSERRDAKPIFGRPTSLLRSPPPDDPYNSNPEGNNPADSPPPDDPYDHNYAGSPSPPDVDAEPLHIPERRSRASTLVRSHPASPSAYDHNPSLKSPPPSKLRPTRDGTVIVDETIVPETDSSHNTQSQSQGGDAKKSSPKENKSPPNSSPMILNGNTRRTPTIDFANVNKSKAPLHPIPRISPRVFHPHLKFNEEPPSSSRDTIEPFSPEKAPQPSRSTNRSTLLVDEDEDAVLRRLQQGKEMAEKAAKERRLREKGEPQPKRTLDEIIALSRQEAQRREQRKEQARDVGVDVEHSEPRELVPATQESADLHVGEDTRTQDESDVKADPHSDAQLVPMEEEETTQDVRDEMARLLGEQDRQDQMEWELGGDGSRPPDDDGPDIPMEDLAYPADHYEEDDQAAAAASRTSSRSPSPTSGVGPSSQIPPTASLPLEPPSLSQIQIDAPEEVKLAYDRALVLLNEKSEEIKRLEEDLSQERSENDKLTVKLQSLGQKLAEAKLPRPSSRNTDADMIALLQRQLEEEREARKQVTEALEAANASVAAASESLQAANAAKLSAEKDRELFREQYAQASAYVTTVRDENRDLEKRIEIAEGQTRDGVAMVRQTFETKVKELETNARMWRNMANFLIQKDQRTDDEVRRRAALEPELRARCQELEGKLELKDVNIEQLENDLEQVQQQRGKLEEEIEKLKSEVARLSEEGELVYRCEWRVNGSVCPNAFDTVQELEQHMFNAGHLTR